MTLLQPVELIMMQLSTYSRLMADEIIINAEDYRNTATDAGRLEWSEDLDLEIGEALDRSVMNRSVVEAILGPYPQLWEQWLAQTRGLHVGRKTAEKVNPRRFIGRSRGMAGNSDLKYSGICYSRSTEVASTPSTDFLMDSDPSVPGFRAEARLRHRCCAGCGPAGLCNQALQEPRSSSRLSSKDSGELERLVLHEGASQAYVGVSAWRSSSSVMTAYAAVLMSN